MKKTIIIVAMALLTLNVSATENPVKPSESLRNEIVDLLGTSLTFDNYLYNDPVEDRIRVEVIFTVNNQGEVIILSTNGPNKSVERTIKKKLNYKKVDFRTTKKGEIYLLPLIVKCIC